MKKTVYVLGNPLLPSDSLPLKLLPHLRESCPDFLFEILDPTEEISLSVEQDLILIDTIIGVKKVTVFHNLSSLALSPRVTVHDYDLPINLGMLQKLRKIKKITIIGVPQKRNLKEILREVINALYPAPKRPDLVGDEWLIKTRRAISQKPWV